MFGDFELDSTSSSIDSASFTTVSAQSFSDNEKVSHIDRGSEYLGELETEAIFVLREVAAEFKRPVALFSGGKDSIVVLRLIEKAFYPSPFAFPLLHVDTGHNFKEVLQFRDAIAAELGANLIVASVQEGIDRGLISPSPNDASRNRLQTPVLLKAIKEGGFDAIIGGARRDEEKARAKERIFSHRDEFGQWDPRRQRPELWRQYNTLLHEGESMRVFPISNWTELDVWRYIKREHLQVPSIYYSHERAVAKRDGQWIAITEHTPLRPGEHAIVKSVRTRTVGDVTCTGCIESSSASIDDVLSELGTLATSERASRADDRFSATAMEDRKREGYF